MSWADLFERAEAYRTDPETVRETLAAHRDADDAEPGVDDTETEADDGKTGENDA